MDTETMIRNLKKVETDHKDDKVFTGQLNIAAMTHDTRKRLEELKPYEDTGLTPQEIMGKVEALKIYQEEGLTPDQIRELKERDTAKAPEIFDGHWYKYPTCGTYAGGLKGNFCHRCGQRLKWED